MYMSFHKQMYLVIQYIDDWLYVSHCDDDQVL